MVSQGIDVDGYARQREWDSRDVPQTIVPSREIDPLKCDEIDELGKCQGQHGEIDPMPFDTQIAQDEGCDRPHEKRTEQPEPDVLPYPYENDPQRICPHAEIGCVAEREHSRVPETDIVTKGEKSPNDDLCGQSLVWDNERKNDKEYNDKNKRIVGNQFHCSWPKVFSGCRLLIRAQCCFSIRHRYPL